LKDEGKAMKIFSKAGTIAVASLMGLVLVGAVAFGQAGSRSMQKAARPEGMHRFGHQGWGRGHMAFAKLNLTDAQKAQMKQIRENHKAAVSSLRQQLGTQEKALRDAESGGTFNEALASQKLAEMAPLRAKLMAEQFAMRQEFMNVLTPEQKAQLTQMRNEWKAKRAAHRPAAA